MIVLSADPNVVVIKNPIPISYQEVKKKKKKKVFYLLILNV